MNDDCNPHGIVRPTLSTESDVIAALRHLAAFTVYLAEIEETMDSIRRNGKCRTGEDMLHAYDEQLAVITELTGMAKAKISKALAPLL